ncbi:MAG TPA: DUF1579 domain-containing protein [Ignavibacteria bacterium]|nr:DUF1579 domain-containing protein [Ignavibacteria bacterium]HMR40413.1 DUF1579 domain-containing protein [Ignavibacteria bacterium]
MRNPTKFFVLIFIFTLTAAGYSQSEIDMKAWTEYMTPGPVHEMLAESNGEWTEDISFWMDPTAPPMKASGTAVNKMILGGRYQMSNSTAEMMGMPFEGMNIVGYDNARKIFQSTWIDNFGTGTSYSEGTWDEDSKSIEFKGNSYDPMTGTNKNIKQIFKIIDSDHQSLEMYLVEDGKETKTMEIMFTRK